MAAISAWFLSFFLLLISDSSSDSTDNPADKLVSLLNSNRTAHKSTALFSNAGLGCIALQYLKAYQGKCKDLSADKKKPVDSNFAEIFAPNCNVQISTLVPLTGRLLGCQGDYIQPEKAFPTLVVPSTKSLEILYNKNHTQVGAAVSGTDGGSPYFWCVLFSAGKANSSFVLDHGMAKLVGTGCFSGNNDECSGSVILKCGVWKMAAVTAFVAVFGAFVAL